MTPSSTRLAATALVAGLVLSGVGACSSGGTTSTGSTGASTATSPGATASPVGAAVANPWARQSPAATSKGAVYMDLTSASGDKLVAASVPASVAAKVELHETVAGEIGGSTTAMSGSASSGSTAMVSSTTMAGTDSSMKSSGTTLSGGMAGAEAMTMRPVTAIELPAGKTVQLKPGGYHVMLIDLAKPLVAGENLPVTLTFEKAPPQTITVTVRSE